VLPLSYIFAFFSASGVWIAWQLLDAHRARERGVHECGSAVWHIVYIPFDGATDGCTDGIPTYAFAVLATNKYGCSFSRFRAAECGMLFGGYAWCPRSAPKLYATKLGAGQRARMGSLCFRPMVLRLDSTVAALAQETIAPLHEAGIHLAGRRGLCVVCDACSHALLTRCWLGWWGPPDRRYRSC
jgi:hypothetical protein